MLSLSDKYGRTKKAGKGKRMWRVQFTAEGQVKLIVQLDTATFNDQVQLYFDVITKKV